MPSIPTASSSWAARLIAGATRAALLMLSAVRRRRNNPFFFGVAIMGCLVPFLQAYWSGAGPHNQPRVLATSFPSGGALRRPLLLSLFGLEDSFASGTLLVIRGLSDIVVSSHKGHSRTR